MGWGALVLYFISQPEMGSGGIYIHAGRLAVGLLQFVSLYLAYAKILQPTLGVRTPREIGYTTNKNIDFSISKKIGRRCLLWPKLIFLQPQLESCHTAGMTERVLFNSATVSAI